MADEKTGVDIPSFGEAEKEVKEEKKAEEKKGFDMAALKKAIEEKIKARKTGKIGISLETGKVIEGDEKEKAKKAGKLQRVYTGIPGLDDQIQGGFVKDSVNLVAGSPGAGKSIFAMQFIVKGITEYDESGIYVSFEEKKEKFYKYMLEFGWDLQKLEDEGKFAFVRYSPEQVHKLLEEGGGTIENVVKKIGAKRIAIDSITAFTLLHKDELAKREALLALFDIINLWGCTTVLTAEQEAEPEKHEPNVVEFEVDGVILLYNFRRKNIRQRVAEVLKMRGTKFTQKIFPMRISDEGIVFYPEEAAF